MAKKIEMKTPLVEMDGDEMTRIMWAWVKEKLLMPFIDLKVEYYDLGLPKRDEIEDKITVEAAEAIKKYGVGVKCATITPDKKRIAEYKLKQEWKSPNGTIRAILDGTVFRKPIMVKNIQPVVPTWKKPIIVGRHAYGDVYKNAEIKVEGKGKGELVFTDSNGKETRVLIQEFKSPGILQGIHNLDSSIQSFARSCMTYALDQKMDLWFGIKDTISKTYDGNFKKIFNEVYEKEFKQRFEEAKITYNLTLIDDTVARVMRSDGGFLWACKNYDGDVMSDMVASAFGSLAMMTSVLVSPNGWFEYEAAHGTVQKHYYKYKAGEKTSTNPTALIFAWTGALRKRAQIDHLPELERFAEHLENATIETVEQGYVTKDLEKLCNPPPQKVMFTEEFIDKVKENLAKRLSQ